MIGYDASELDILENRCKRILVKMALLANGACATFDSSGKSRYAPKGGESKEPRGIKLNGSASHDLSLAEFWTLQLTAAWQDVQAGDPKAPERIESLLGRAHASYRMFTSRGLVEQRREDTVVRDKRILHRYEGMHAGWVAAVEDCSIDSVKRLRGKDGRDPVYGLREDDPIKCDHCGARDFEQVDRNGRRCSACGHLMSSIDALAA